MPLKKIQHNYCRPFYLFILYWFYWKSQRWVYCCKLHLLSIIKKKLLAHVIMWMPPRRCLDNTCRVVRPPNISFYSKVWKVLATKHGNGVAHTPNKHTVWHQWLFFVFCFSLSLPHILIDPCNLFSIYIWSLSFWFFILFWISHEITNVFLILLSLIFLIFQIWSLFF